MLVNFVIFFVVLATITQVNLNQYLPYEQFRDFIDPSDITSQDDNHQSWARG